MTKEPQTITLPDGSVWKYADKPENGTVKWLAFMEVKQEPELDPFGELDNQLASTPWNGISQSIWLLTRALIKLCDGRYVRK